MQDTYTFKPLNRQGLLALDIYINGTYEGTMYSDKKYPATRAQRQMEKEARQTWRPIPRQTAAASLESISTAA